MTETLREICPSTEFFLVRIFPHLDLIRFECEIRSECGIFSPNAGKYGPGETPYLDPFHAMKTQRSAKLWA